MKMKTYLMAPAMIAALLLAACNGDDGVDMDRPIALNFSTDGVVTRATIAETGETFEAGDRVGVYLSTGNTDDEPSAIGAGAAVDNEPFAKQSGGRVERYAVLAEHLAVAHLPCLLPLRCRAEQQHRHRQGRHRGGRPI